MLGNTINMSQEQTQRKLQLCSEPACERLVTSAGLSGCLLCGKYNPGVIDDAFHSADVWGMELRRKGSCA